MNNYEAQFLKIARRAVQKEFELFNNEDARIEEFSGLAGSEPEEYADALDNLISELSDIVKVLRG